jgi:hypothetical protein
MRRRSSNAGGGQGRSTGRRRSVHARRAAPSRRAQKAAGILKIGGVMQSNSCHTPYPYGVIAHTSTFRSAGRLPKDLMEDMDLLECAEFV